MPIMGAVGKTRRNIRKNEPTIAVSIGLMRGNTFFGGYWTTVRNTIRARKIRPTTWDASTKPYRLIWSRN